MLTLSQTSPGFYVSAAQGFWKHWDKKKLLVTSNFLFSPSVFYPFRELSPIFIKFEIVICKLFQFGKVLKFVIWERVKWMIHISFFRTRQAKRMRRKKKQIQWRIWELWNFAWIFVSVNLVTDWPEQPRCWSSWQGNSQCFPRVCYIIIMWLLFVSYVVSFAALTQDAYFMAYQTKF